MIDALRNQAQSHETTRPNHERGFTLIELLVSLSAGLIVAMAVVALSGNATQTFHEEARASTAEMTLRTSVERLRADLQRAGFMGTGNVQKDTSTPLDSAGARPSAPTGLYNLAGIHLVAGGSAAATPMSNGANGNNFNPDQIDLSGNFTSSDQYVVRTVTTGGCGQRLILTPDSAAMWRLQSGGTANATAALLAMFQPVPGQEFLVRVTDDLGRYEFYRTCSTGGAATGFSAGDATWFVDLQPVPLINLANYGFVTGRLSVSPIQTVRWEITGALNAGYRAVNTDPDKYNLVRSWINVTTGAPFAFAAGPPVINPTELIAEYAVDLKFAFTVDPGLYNQTAPTLNVLKTYGFDDTENATIAAPVGPTAVTTMPQRIRSVRLRISTRSAIPDREADMRLPLVIAPQDKYTLRYCVLDAGAACITGKRQWARVRTVISEVSLPNQARAFY